MSALPYAAGDATEVLAAKDDAFDTLLASGLAERGWAVCKDFLPLDRVHGLASALRSAQRRGRLHAAATGSTARRVFRPDVRSDRICWLEPPGQCPAEAALLERLERLRANINRELQLGLFDLESHYALYAKGARYVRHLDRFADDDRRVLSCVLYLNGNWTAVDGGQLRLHLHAGEVSDILPVGGTLAVFLSAGVEHEVLPAARERMSIAGWFRRRGEPV